ncbi:hypothetical protein ACJIZ3_015378 [Penstemon smallii]|uniref:RING-type domain-containing protein n=1 Tax=Penstemon smallii TaxID=265156 RepID=A0ABD3RUN5_9LAMI
MGAACCIAAKDRTITNGPPSETLQRHTRYSPSWSFRWDNRGRVAGEETSANWLHGGGGLNNRLEVKSDTNVGTAYASEEGSPLDSFRSHAWQKSPVSEGNTGNLRLPSSDQATLQNSVEVKESTESPSISYPSPVKLSPSAPSVSSISTSPPLPPNSSLSRWNRRSPGHCLLRQVSDSPIPEYKSPTFSISEEPSSFLPLAWANESARGSNGGSSDSWSIPAFSDLMSTRRERWSFDSETLSFSREKITRNSRSPSFDLQTCGVCTKNLTERSSCRWSSQKIISSNEIAVVSVLTCGHVYHAECLEYMTSEINKYDPACPVCTFGAKRTLKMSEKALKAEMDSKGRKRSRKRVIDSDFNSDISFDSHKSGEVEGRGIKMNTSSSMKISNGKPFLRRYFSFGSKSNTSMSENQSMRKKSFFWTRSSKV